MTPARSSEGAHLLDYIRVLLKRLWLIVGVFILVVGIVGVLTWRSVPLYRATATINIQPPNVVWGQIDPTMTVHSVNQSQKYMNTQYELLKQRALIRKMVETREMASLWKEFRERKMSEEAIVHSLAGRVSVNPDDDSFFVKVSVVYEDQALVARLANALVATFKEVQTEAAKGALEDRSSTLKATSEEYRIRADLTNSQIDTLMAQHDTDRESFLQSLAAARDRYAELLRQKDETEAELARLLPRYQRIKESMKDEEGGKDGLRELFGESFVLEAPFVQAERKAIEQMEYELEALVRRKALGGSNERVVEFRAQIAERKRSLDFDIRMLLRGYLSKYEDLLVFLRAVQDRKEAVRREMRELSQVMREFETLEKRLEQLEMEHDRYFGVFEKLEANTLREVKPVIILEEAKRPPGPFKPDKQTNMFIAVVFGLLGGMGLAFFLEYMDDTVKTKEELQRVTDVPLFGVIPNIAGPRGDVRRKDLYAYDQPKSTTSEAFRGVRTAISYSSQRTDNRVYLVTSSGPKEGKSTITINVATVMAYSGTRTILVDADLRRPRIHKSFGLSNSVGLTNVIVGDVPVEEAVQPTGVENLFVLPSGPIPPNPSELLGRERMVEVLDELRRAYDRVMLDTPPIGAVTDAAVLGRIVDSVILVVHAGRTRKKLIERSLEQLSQIDVDVAGIVLNNLRVGSKRYSPGYYDYYYYSSYYGSDDESRPRKTDADRV